MKSNNLKFILQASVAAFGAYFCMYAFRKPFTVATFSELSFLGIDYKIWLVVGQVLGYTLSKFVGIKLIAEMPKSKRFIYLVSFILFAELALLGFAMVSAPYNIIFLFLNGLPLGMIWGIVFSYLEGRKSTEILGVILCSSFIVSSGAVKSIGKLVMDSWHFSEFWMPFITGLLFIIPLVLFAFLLNRLPEPSSQDEQTKCKRATLNKAERTKLYKEFALPLTLIVVFYVFLTGVRDFRDNFAREIWDSLGFSNSAAIYSFSEIPIAVSVLIIMIAIGSITKNFRAFACYHLVLCAGGLLIGISTVLFQFGVITPVLWMIISGFGMYICYIPFQGLFFDRMIATFKIKGNVGFLIYLADAFGYLGSVIILFYKNFVKANISYLNFFTSLILIVAVLAVSISIISYVFFNNKKQKTIVQPNILIHE
ncbi:DUF5690 family protein [Tamlana crocina]